MEELQNIKNLISNFLMYDINFLEANENNELEILTLRDYAYSVGILPFKNKL